MDTIVPGQGIGRYRLGEKFSRYGISEEEIVEREHRYDCDVYKTRTLWFWVGTQHGEVTQIMVTGNYTGKVFDKIGIGNTLDDVKNMLGSYEEVLDTYTLPSHPGLCFELRDDDSEDEWDELKEPIASISVYIAENSAC